MIKVNELRLGNLLTYGEHGPATVKEIKESGKIKVLLHSKESHEAGFDSSIMHIAQFDPIPLMPELMEQCGFARDEENEVYSIQIGNAIYLEYDKDFDCAITPEDRPGSSGYLWGENKSVHQLQNLYYRLTGKELEIKLP